MAAPQVDLKENRRRMAAGELYYAFTPDLIADRRRCRLAFEAYNKAGDVPRRRMVELWKAITDDKTPLPPQASTDEEDEAQLEDYPWVDGPIKLDYGYNVKYDSLINSNSTWIDTCTISVGSRTLMGPNCSFYSGTHPLDPHVRNGTRGPESGKPITIEEDCWLGGNVTVLAGVTIGKGATVGAGSVVTKDVAPYTVVVGNPARLLRKIEVSNPDAAAQDNSGTEVLAGEKISTV